ncbi:MAG: hypothetical protein ACRDE8_12155, partial [Ginsengibacter sp.]
MNRVLLLMLLLSFPAFKVSSQSFSVHDLLNLADLPSNGISNYMFRNGFIRNRDVADDEIQTSFIPKIKKRNKDEGIQQRVDFYGKDSSRYFIFRTLLKDEYLEGEERLIKSGFIYDKRKNIRKDSLILFQKKNISVLASIKVEDSVAGYTFE